MMNRGFSLTELVIALGVGSFLMIGAYQIFNRSVETQSQTIKSASFVKKVTVLRRAIEETLDRFGYNSQLQPYEIIGPLDADGVETREPIRIGITYFFNNSIKGYWDTSRDGVLDLTANPEEKIGFWLDDPDTPAPEVDSTSDLGEEPCTRDEGTHYAKLLQLKHYVQGEERILSEKVLCLEIQYYCEIDVDTDGTCLPNPGEPATDHLRKWKRWWVSRTTTFPIPENRVDVDAVPFYADPQNEYFKFIRDRLDMVRVGIVLQGSCDLSERNPVTNNFCQSSRMVIEHELNPPWKDRYAMACVPPYPCGDPDNGISLPAGTYPSMDDANSAETPPNGDDPFGGNDAPPGGSSPSGGGGSPFLEKNDPYTQSQGSVIH